MLNYDEETHCILSQRQHNSCYSHIRIHTYIYFYPSGPIVSGTCFPTLFSTSCDTLPLGPVGAREPSELRGRPLPKIYAKSRTKYSTFCIDFGAIDPSQNLYNKSNSSLSSFFFPCSITMRWHEDVVCQKAPASSPTRAIVTASPNPNPNIQFL